MIEPKRKKIHVCQSVEGALKLWKRAEWRHVARMNDCTVDQAKEKFWEYLRNGVLVIPLGTPCEGFDYKKGCQGHILED